MLTRSADLPHVVAGALTRLRAPHLLVVGGPAAVANGVLGSLDRLVYAD